MKILTHPDAQVFGSFPDLSEFGTIPTTDTPVVRWALQLPEDIEPDDRPGQSSGYVVLSLEFRTNTQWRIYATEYIATSDLEHVPSPTISQVRRRADMERSLRAILDRFRRDLWLGTIRLQNGAGAPTVPEPGPDPELTEKELANLDKAKRYTPESNPAVPRNGNSITGSDATPNTITGAEAKPKKIIVDGTIKSPGTITITPLPEFNNIGITLSELRAKIDHVQSIAAWSQAEIEKLKKVRTVSHSVTLNPYNAAAWRAFHGFEKAEEKEQEKEKTPTARPTNSKGDYYSLAQVKYGIPGHTFLATSGNVFIPDYSALSMRPHPSLDNWDEVYLPEGATPTESPRPQIRGLNDIESYRHLTPGGGVLLTPKAVVDAKPKVKVKPAPEPEPEKQDEEETEATVTEPTFPQRMAKLINDANTGITINVSPHLSAVDTIAEINRRLAAFRDDLR